MEENRWPLLIRQETIEILAREKEPMETWDTFLLGLIERPSERNLTGDKGKLWQDLNKAIVPVLKKWDVPGSSAGSWDLYEALGIEVAKIDWMLSKSKTNDTFHRWLKRQRDRKDLIGHLAYDMTETDTWDDVKKPRGRAAGQKGKWIEYLSRMHVDDVVFDAFEAAWLEYKGLRKTEAAAER